MPYSSIRFGLYCTLDVLMKHVMEKKLSHIIVNETLRRAIHY